MTQRDPETESARGTSRRSLLKAAGTVSAVGVLGLAGCASRGGNTDDGSTDATWEVVQRHARRANRRYSPESGRCGPRP